MTDRNEQHSSRLEPRAAARGIALTIIAVLIGAAAAASFAESYRGLLDWALTHGLPIGWAVIAPLMVDVFIAVGELTLFVLVLDDYDWQSRWPAWLITGCGLALSVAGNVGHTWHGGELGQAPVATMITAGVPPVAAAWSLAVGLGLLKRLTRAEPYVSKQPAQRATATVSKPEPRQRRAIAAPVPDLTAAADAYRASISAGAPLSARQLANDHLGGNRRAAGRVIAAAQ